MAEFDRSLDSLSAEAYALACAWIARCTAREVQVLIVQTSRTQAQHQVNFLAGTSSTQLSRHLPRKMRWPLDQPRPIPDPERCDAVDLAPYAQYQLHGPDKLQWDTTDPAWGIIGEECERVGLRWGGRWLRPFDPGHGELIFPWTSQRVQEERTRPWPYPRPLRPLASPPVQA